MRGRVDLYVVSQLSENPPLKLVNASESDWVFSNVHLSTSCRSLFVVLVAHIGIAGRHRRSPGTPALSTAYSPNPIHFLSEALEAERRKWKKWAVLSSGFPTSFPSPTLGDGRRGCQKTWTYRCGSRKTKQERYSVTWNYGFWTSGPLDCRSDVQRWADTVIADGSVDRIHSHLKLTGGLL